MSSSYDNVMFDLFQRKQIQDQIASQETSNEYASIGSGSIFRNMTDAEIRQADRINNLNEEDGLRAVVNKANGIDYSDMPEFERDMANLSPAALYLKYGASAEKMISVRSQGEQNLFNMDLKTRSNSAAFGDTINDLISTPIEMIGGLTALGTSLFSDQYAANMVDQINEIDEFSSGLQSERLQNRRKIAEIKSDSEAEKNDAIRNKNSENDGRISGFMRDMMRIGRGVISTLDVSTDDATVFGSDLTQATSSLLVGGLVSKGIRAAGKAVVDPLLKVGVKTGALNAAGTVAPKILDAGSKLAFPVAIGGLEGGGAFADTVSSVMAMNEDQLFASSPEYAELRKTMTHDEAKLELATNAGRKAGAIQFGVGAVTGKLVEGIEKGVGNLLTAGGEGLTRAVAKEGLEEGIQGASGSLAKNYALSTEVNPEQNLLEGVGEGLAEGALFGSLSTGLIGAPGASAKAVVDAGGNVIQSVMDRGERIINETGLKKPDKVLETNINNTIEPEIIQNDPVIKTVDNSENIQEPIVETPEIVETIEPVVEAEPIVISENKQLQELYAGVKEKDLAIARDNTDAQINSFIKRSEDTELTDTPEYKAFKIEQLERKLKSPEVQSVIKLSEISPENVDPDINDQILLQSEKGEIPLTDTQKLNIQTASDLVRVQKEYKETRSALSKVMRPTPDAVTKEIRSGGGSAPSAVDHFKMIVGAYRKGDTATAKDQLEKLILFGQTLQNKVAAINNAFVTGDNNTRYENVIAGTRKMLLSEKGLGVTKTSRASVGFAQQIQADANAVTTLANNLAKTLNLGVKPIQTVNLVQDLQGDIDEVVTKFSTKVEKEKETQPEVVSETETNDVPVESETEAVVENEPVVENDNTFGSDIEIEPEVDPLANLVGSKNEDSIFKKAFKPSKTERTRTSKSETPFKAVRDALSSKESFEAYTGKKAPATFTKAAAVEMNKYLGQANNIARTLVQNLNIRLSKKDAEGRTWGDLIIEGGLAKTKPNKETGVVSEYDPRLAIDGKALNLVDEADGKLTYNSKLMAEALLAGMQWLLVTERFTSDINLEDAAEILNMEVGTFDNSLIIELNKGLQTVQAKRSLAEMIKKYWGMNADREIDQATVEGIAESMAAEVIRAFVENGLMTMDTIKIEKNKTIDGKPRNINIFKPIELDVESNLNKNATLIEEVVFPIVEKNIFIGEVPKIQNISRTQMNNPRVENTDEQRRAALADSQTPYYLNTNMSLFLRQIGSDAVIELFGEGNLENKKLNEEHKKILEGRNLTISSAYKSMINLIDDLESREEETDKIPVYFLHNFSSVGRMQMLGKNNPQASKLMREVLMSTGSTLDLNNEKDFSRYMLALAQALGVKVHAKSRAAAFDELQEKIDKMKPAIDLLVSWDRTNNELQAEDIEILKSTFQNEMDFMGFHALMDYARYQNAKEDGDLSGFETKLYIEADGITNGPMMAMMMATTGRFTPKWLRNVAKGGINYFRDNYSMNEHRQNDNVDLYEEALSVFQIKRKELVQSVQNSNEIKNQIGFVTNLMGILLPDVEFNDDNSVTFKRGIVKNPLTITLYGSGAEGIAGNLVDDLKTAIYERLSLSMQRKVDNPNISEAEAMFGDIAMSTRNAEEIYKNFNASLNALINSSVYYNKKRELNLTGSQTSQNLSVNPETFVFSTEQAKNLIKNVQHLFVGPMREAVSETVGHELMQSMDLMRVATQAQSVFLKYDYINKVEKVTADRGVGNFLSKKEEDEIFDSQSDLSPFVTNGSQIFYPSGSNKVELGQKEFGRGLGTPDMRTDAYYYGPENSGVRGMPMMIIGFGDGYMMQKLSLMENAVQGTLKVFDGVNIPLDQMELGSEQANEAAFTAMMNNPLQAVFESYDKFITNVVVSDLNQEQKNELVNGLYSFDERDTEKTDQDIMTRMREVHADLKRSAMEATARHNVLKRTKLSIDQMAAVGAPYANDGTIDLTGFTPSQAAEALNEEFRKELDLLKSKDAELQKEIQSKKLVNALSFKDKGVTRTTHNQLVKIVSKLGVTPEQMNILRPILRSLLTKEYQIVSGSLDNIRQWADKNGRRNIPAESELTGEIKGFTVFGDKTIYLTTTSTETLVHELIHAATFENVVDYYKGADLGPLGKEQSAAIQRIEVLMDQFLTLDEIGELKPSARQAFYNAVAAIKGYLNSTTGDQALNKAAALNEFMAWALTNKNLTGQLSETKANPLVVLAKQVFESIKALVWGRKKFPKPDDDMLSNLQFNTSLLLHANPKSSALDNIKDMIAFQSVGYGSNDRLSKIEKMLLNKVAIHIDGLDNVSEETKQQNDFIDFSVKAEAIGQMFSAHGFKMNGQERDTFNMLVSVLGTQIQLDPNSLSEIQELYSHVVKNLKVEDFMANPNSENPNDRNTAQEKYDAILGNYGVANDAQGRSTLLSAFLALSIVSDDFRLVLAKIKAPEVQLEKWNTTDNILNNLGVQMMDRLNATMSGADRKAINVQFAMNVLTDRFLKVSEERESRINQAFAATHGIIDKTNDLLIGVLNKGADTVIDYAENIKTKTDNRFAKGTLSVLQATVSLVNEDKTDAIRAGLMSNLNQRNVPKPMFDLVNEFNGRTKESAPIYDMIKLVRSRVQQVRQQYREELPRILEKKFTRPVKDSEWTTMFHGLAKTDLAALAVKMKRSDLVDMLKNYQQVVDKIKEQETVVQNMRPKDWVNVKQRSENLAEYMVNGKIPQVLLRNSYAVANLIDMKNNQNNVPAEYVFAVDQLISLYAFNALDNSIKNDLSLLVQQEENGVMFITDYLVGQRETEIEKTNRTLKAKLNYYKGFIPSDSQEDYSLIVAEIGDPIIKEKGYTFVAKYEKSNADVFKDINGKKLNSNGLGYYLSKTAQRSAFSQGILQNAHLTTAGVDPLTGYTNIHPIAGRITNPYEVKAITQRLNKNVGNEPLMPIFGDKGEIIAFERSINIAQEALLKKSTNIAKMIGVWRGRQIEEYEAENVNKTLVNRLYEIWNEQKSTRSNEFVNLFDTKNLKDPIMIDAVNLFNTETREYIKSVFLREKNDSKTPEFWVRRDMIDDVIGYRKASVGDIWTGNSRWSDETRQAFQKVLVGVFGADAYKRLVYAEKLLHNFVADARVTIVVKSVIVPIANLAANFIQLLSRGVPVQDIVKGMLKKTAEINLYTKNRLREIELEAELRASLNDPKATLKINTELKSIRDSYRRLSIWPLVQAGEFASISDTAISQEEISLVEGRLGEYIENLTSKLPEGVKTLGRYGLVARDTALFQGMQKAVEYGDFLGKTVLYDHLTQKKKMSSEDALGRITEEFVNYDRLPGRFRAYLEQSGLIWFWHFKIRATKIALSMLQNNPFHFFLATALPSMGGMAIPGSPVMDNVISVLMSDHRLPYSVGIDQAINAHALNPWVQIMG